MLQYSFYILSVLLVTTIILEIHSFNLIDASLTFFVLTNLLLNISTALFYLYFSNYLLSLINIFSLFVFALLFFKDLKRIIGYYPLRFFPYLFLIIYKFFEISIIFIQTI